MTFIKKLYRSPYMVLGTIYLFFIIYALILDPVQQIWDGIKIIVTSSGILITDYIELAGIGATLINSGVIGLISILILVINAVKPNGSTIMSLWLLTGFSMFGKNLINIWPIIFGGWLYAKIKKEPFLNYSLVTILSTTLAPVVSQSALWFNNNYNIMSILFGGLVGIAIGFIMPAVSTHMMRSHGGYVLYNVGLAAGILAIVISALFKGFGMELEPQVIWNTTSNNKLGIFLIIIFIFLILTGLFLGQNNKENLLKIHKHSGRLLTDYYFYYGESSYINVGIVGLFSTFVVIMLGSNINGPTIAGIFSIAGFGVLGKHMRNITPVMVGCVIGSLISVNNVNDPSVVLAVLFGTCLAPFSAAFGWPIGILAGYLHVNIVLILTPIHGGLNLYNNGLAGGIVGMMLLPIIHTFKRSDSD